MMNLHEKTIPGLKIPGSLAVSLAALILTSIFVIGSAWLITVSLTESSVEAKQADVVSRLLASNKMMDTAEERFNGRSIFYVPREPIRDRPPPPPPRVPDRTPAPDPEPRPEPPPPPPPSAYAGPEIQSILGNNVFFANGKRVSVGETMESVKVLQIHGPFTVRLGWREGEFDVELFAQDMPSFFAEKPFNQSTRTELVSEGSTSSANSRSTSSAESSSRGTRPGGNTPVSGSGSNQVPVPLTDKELASLSRSEITGRIGDLFRGMRAKDIDPETKNKLDEERKKLMQMLREGAGNEQE